MSQSQRGGKRAGAGRKAGSGVYKEATIVKRIPASALPALEDYLDAVREYRQSDCPVPPPVLGMRTPVALNPVQAGLLTAAESDISDYVDFNEYLVRHPYDTIGIYAVGTSMVDAGIDEGDLLVVDRKSQARHRDIVVADIDNAFTVKRLIQKEREISLHPENETEHFPEIHPQPGQELRILGVVTFVIKRL